MEILTTHTGADFDAFASMLGARRLHPEAGLFFPGSREKSVRRMLEAAPIDFAELKPDEVDPAALTRVVLCDVRQPGRIGPVADWLAARPEIEVWAYDHHPAAAGDLAASGGRIDPGVGATSTLIVEELRSRGLIPSADEATVLLAGIHEDTGSLTHATTSRRDCEAAGWLLDQGADLAAVRRFAVPVLDPDRLDVLHRMTHALEVFHVHDLRVGVVALELGEYVDELAPLVGRCRELFELPLVVALFGEGDAVTAIARGEVPGVDLGRLMAGFAGGGGHPTAASARLRGEGVIAARERLLAYLETALPPAARAADLMVSGFVVVPAGSPIGRAKELINQRRVNAAPVAAADGSGRLVGAVTRQILDAALQHGLAERPVETVMDPELEWVEPDSPADDVGRRILDRHPRFVLVGDRGAGRAEGLITRMQVLRHLQGRLVGFADRLDRRARERAEERKGVGDLLAGGLTPELAGRVEAAARVSRRHGIPVYLVGGMVRDLLLGRENRDLDLVVEGDGLGFARLLAAELGGRVREHRAFLTAVVVDPEGLHLDVASARSEFYRAPAALPEVETSALRQDLYRRDFTINTLAVRLGPEPSPVLIDYFGGRRDLEAGTIRVLHSLSFIDDPTRVLRAVRLEQRLGFRISPETLQLIAVALSERVFERLSGFRLREELVLLLADPALVLRGVERLAELGLLAVVHPALVLDHAVRRRLRGAVAAYDWFRFQGLAEPQVELWRLALAALVGGLPDEAVAAVADRLALAGDDRRFLTGAAERRRRAAEALDREPLAAHAISDALEPLGGEDLLLVLAAGGERVRERVRRDLCELRRFALAIGGNDLVAAGVEPGPAVGEALRRTRRARLDGEIAAADELDHALAVARGLLAVLLALVLGLPAFAAHSQEPPQESTRGVPGEDPASRIHEYVPPWAVRPEAPAEERPGPDDPTGRPPPDDADRVGSDITTELLRFACGGKVARRDVTLFANGTVRARHWQPSGETMALGELSPDEVKSLVELLDGIDLSETDTEPTGPSGATVPSCRVVLTLSGRERTELAYSSLEAPSAPLGRLLAVVDDLERRAGPPRGRERLPTGYEPKPGDVLKRADGALFEVVAFTLEGRGLELQGTEQPLTLYVDKGALDREFVAVVSEAER